MSNPIHTGADASRSSHYVNDALYGELVGKFSDWAREDRAIADPALREAFRMLLEREARLLDQCRFEDWLDLYARECLYWVPTTPHGGDPRREVCICFDDRRRLEDRIFRLRTGYAWSQVPPSRTVHMVSNVELFGTAQGSTYLVRSNVLITEFRSGEIRTLSGWCGHHLVRQDEKWKIAVKQVNLIDCDQNLRNLSFVL